jgi:predicted DNA-binding ribbon-helix-helix protein
MSGGRIVKRSVTISGHRTSLSLEEPFWQAARALAERRGQSLARLLAGLDTARAGGLSSALRLAVLAAYQTGELPSAPGAPPPATEKPRSTRFSSGRNEE